MGECDGKEKKKCLREDGTCKKACGQGEEELLNGCKGSGCKCCVSGKASARVEQVRLTSRMFNIRHKLRFHWQNRSNVPSECFFFLKLDLNQASTISWCCSLRVKDEGMEKSNWQ